MPTVGAATYTHPVRAQRVALDDLVDELPGGAVWVVGGDAIAPSG